MAETKGKATPGPWKNNGGRIETERDAYDGGIIATVGIVNKQDRADTANAELIAAAPDLLEALNGFLTFTQGTPLGLFALRWDEAVDKARTAIAKADPS